MSKHFISCIGELLIYSSEEYCLSCFYSGSGYDDPHTSFGENLSILAGLPRRICKSVHNIFMFPLQVPFMLHARLLDVIHLLSAPKTGYHFLGSGISYLSRTCHDQPWFSFAFSHLQPEMAKLSEKKVHCGLKTSKYVKPI